MKKIMFIFFISITLVHGQSDTLTIEQSLIMGLNLSKEVHVSNSNVLISEFQTTSARANLLPKLTLGANFNHMSTMPIQLNLPIIPTSTNEELNVFYANATIEQPLFTGFRLLSLKNAAKLNEKASILDNENVKNKKALEIYEAFWNYYKTLKYVEILEENLKVISYQKKNVENFIDSEMATKNDLLKIKVAEASIKSKIIDAQHQSKLALANFNRVVGLSINEKTVIIADELNQSIATEELEILMDEALNSRTELLSNNLRSKAANEKIRAAKSTWFPQVSAFGSYYYMKLDGASLVNSDPNNFWMVGLGIQWRIWDWWNTSANVNIAEQQNYQIDIANKMLREKVEMEVYNSYLKLESETNKINLYKLQVESADENFRIINNKFINQVATSTELEEASTLLAEAKIKLITSFVDYKLAKVQLNNSIGRKIY
jgi:outer membrane protein TolC